MREMVVKLLKSQPTPMTIDEYAKQLENRDRLTPVVREAFEKARTVRADHAFLFYIAGALTGMSEVTKKRYEAVSDLIKVQPGAKLFGYAPHLHGTDPVKHPAVSPAEVRDIDYLWSGVIPDAHINFWDPVAHGNAVEAGWAEERAIPSLHLVPETMVTSRLVRGLHNTIGTLRYEDFVKDGLPQLQNFLSELIAGLSKR
jgi:hypothetical protein